MKILIVSQYFWPESFIINGLVGELKKKGHQVSVLTGLPNYPSGQFTKGYGFFTGPWGENYQGAHVMRVPILARGKGFVRLALNYLSFVISGSVFSLFHRTRDIDVIFCYAPSPITSCLPAIFIRWLTKKPLVFWVQDLWPESVSAVGAVHSSKPLQILTAVVRFIYKHCDLILVPSEGFKRSILEKGVSLEKIKYIPNWAEPFPENSNLPEWISKLPTGFRIGFAGNIGSAQDMPTLLRAAEILKAHVDIKWIIVGDGSEKKWLDQEIKKRGLSANVFEVGKKDYQDMKPFFEACDILYVSLKRSNIFSLTIPSKLQAYMSAGRPILASLDGEGAKLIEDSQSGMGASTETPDALAEKVLKLKKLSFEDRHVMGKNASDYFAKYFERNKVIQQIENLLLSVKK